MSASVGGGASGTSRSWLTLGVRGAGAVCRGTSVDRKRPEVGYAGDDSEFGVGVVVVGGGCGDEAVYRCPDEHGCELIGRWARDGRLQAALLFDDRGQGGDLLV